MIHLFASNIGVGRTSRVQSGRSPKTRSLLWHFFAVQRRHYGVRVAIVVFVARTEADSRPGFQFGPAVIGETIAS